MTRKLVSHSAWLLALAMAVLAMATPASAHRAKTVATTFRMQTVTLDDGRKMDLEIGQPAGKPRALILFSAGSMLTPQWYHVLTSQWVAAGYLVISPVHIDSPLYHNGPSKDGHAILVTRLDDMAYLIRQADSHRTTSPIKALHELSPDFAMFAAGHSYGAYIAQIMGGASVLDQKSQAKLHIPLSPHLRGIVALSPPPVIAGFAPKGSWSTVTVPMLVETGTADVFPGFVDRWQMHLDSYREAPASLAWKAVYDGMNHYFKGVIGKPKVAHNPTARRQLDRFVQLSERFMDLAAAGPVPPSFAKNVAQLSDPQS